MISASEWSIRSNSRTDASDDEDSYIEQKADSELSTSMFEAYKKMTDSQLNREEFTISKVN